MPGETNFQAKAVPEHYTRGESALTITDAIDKARFGRLMPFSEETISERGLIFGRHDRRAQVKKPAESVLTEEQGRRSPCTICATLASRSSLKIGNLPGVAFNARQVQATTTAGHIHSNRRAAERFLASAGPTGFTRSTPNPTSEQNRLVGRANQADPNLCAKERT